MPRGARGPAALLILACAAAAVPARGEDVTVDMSKGGVTFQSGDNSLTVGARAQFRWTADDREDFDADTSGPGVGDEDPLAQQFAVQRMRITFKGGFWKPWLKYEFQFDMANTSGDRDNKIKDAILEVDRNAAAVLKMGQFKTPFSLQELTSSGRQQFVDRAITNAKFAPGRDQGVSLNGLFAGKKLGYGVGAFNGSGESRAQEDEGLLYVGRLWFDPLGEYKLSESANDHSEKNVLHFGIAARTGEAHRGAVTSGTFEEPESETAYVFETAWRYKRFFATGEYFVMRTGARSQHFDNVTDPNNPTPIPGAFTGLDDVESDGWHVQGGVMVVPKKVEVALRYAQIDPDQDVDEDLVSEARLAFGYYFQGHNLKVQADAGQIGFEEAFGPGTSSVAERGMPSIGTRLGGATLQKERTDLQYRVQMQVAF